MYKDLLVGSTGFVGQNLMKSHKFTMLCHSTDVYEQYGSNPDLCIYAGVPAAMFLANTNPKADLEVIEKAFENIIRINPKKLVLISSIAVYDDSRGKDENSQIDDSLLPAYGKNRLKLECDVRKKFPDSLIVRLPALYGIALKKNFLFDLLTITPSMLKQEKYFELSEKDEFIRNSYEEAANGFYKLKATSDRKALRSFFESNDFNALAFTDSRSRFQFYSLSHLWNDISKAIDLGITILNITTPPVSALDVYKTVTGKNDWKNELTKPPFDYDLRSIHADKFGGKNGYLYSLEEELSEIKEFMTEQKQ